MNKENVSFGLIGLLIGIIIMLLAGSSYGDRMGFGNGMMGNRQSSGMSGQINDHFIVQMIPHHEDAIAMADIALEKSEHEEIKQLSRSIKLSQSAEIDSMKKWYKEWYGIEVPVVTTGRMGMSMGMMSDDQVDLTTFANSKPFDKEFIEEMIPHHQMAVMMAQMLLRGTNKPEMKKLGEDIIKAQTSEIEQMREWYKAWYN